MVKRIIIARAMLVLLSILVLWPFQPIHGQKINADVAAYQAGVTAEVKPGTVLTYTITVTNYGPAAVKSFYIVDGWSVNDQGISAFVEPVSEPDFGKFKPVGTWEQSRKDEKVIAWLLDGELVPGDTIQFNWQVRVAENYKGGLVNWARIQINDAPAGTWQVRKNTTNTQLPKVSDMVDPDDLNNRTPDGVTLVTEAPSGQGADMAIFQTGLLTQVQAKKPLNSAWLVTNLGPQTVKKFYVMAGWSLGLDGSSLLAPPVTDPNFGPFKVLGRWKQIRSDEELWLWLLEGELKSGEGVLFRWQRSLVQTYRGDLVNWSRVFSRGAPPDKWTPRDGTSGAPSAIENPTDTNDKNDRSADGITTVID